MAWLDSHARVIAYVLVFFGFVVIIAGGSFAKLAIVPGVLAGLLIRRRSELDRGGTRYDGRLR